MEEYLTKAGENLLKNSIRTMPAKTDAITSWCLTWLHRLIQDDDVPRIYLSLLIELGYIKPKLLQDLDLADAYKKIKAYGMEIIRKSPMNPRERHNAVMELWEEDE